MTGPEHYAAAERCLEDIRDSNLDSDADALLTATMAQAHATLALAAATAQAAATVDASMHEAWHNTLCP